MRLIDADAMKDTNDNVIAVIDPETKSKYWISLNDYINAQPTVDPVKHGEWEYYVTIGCIRVYTHTACGCVVKRKSLYCPLCGAKMTFEGKEVME